MIASTISTTSTSTDSSTTLVTPSHNAITSSDHEATLSDEPSTLSTQDKTVSSNNQTVSTQPPTQDKQDGIQTTLPQERKTIKKWKLSSKGKSNEEMSFELPKHLKKRGSKLFVKSYKQYWKGKKYKKGDEPSAENSGLTPRTLTPFEQAGNNIMITIKTTVAYHRTRIQLLLDTWMSAMNASNVFLVTDGDDTEYEAKARDIGKLNQHS